MSAAAALDKLRYRAQAIRSVPQALTITDTSARAGVVCTVRAARTGRAEASDFAERYIASAKQEAVERHAIVAVRAKSFFGANGWMLIRIMAYNFHSSTHANTRAMASTRVLLT